MERENSTRQEGAMEENSLNCHIGDSWPAYLYWEAEFFIIEVPPFESYDDEIYYEYN